MNSLPIDFGYITLYEEDDKVVSTVNNANVYDFVLFLEENNFTFSQEENIFHIYDPFDEVYEEFLEYDVLVYLTEDNPEEIIFLGEGTAKRKIVIRKGKRKVIFQCPPGQKKINRRCIKRPQKEVQKLKRRARRAARKGRSKRSAAIRKRKISLRKRGAIDKHTHKEPESSKKHPHHK
jgi:hypothetical protein